MDFIISQLMCEGLGGLGLGAWAARKESKAGGGRLQGRLTAVVVARSWARPMADAK